MKIEVDKRGNKDFYNEIFYVALKYKNIIKKPNTKIHNITKHNITQIIIFTLLFITYLYFYFIFKETLYIFLLGAIFFIEIYIIIYTIKLNKRIDILMNEKDTKTIEINEKNVSFKDEIKEISVKWEKVKMIMINRYSISFIPNEMTIPVISIQIEYKDKVLEALKKYDKTSLIIDNSDIKNKE